MTSRKLLVALSIFMISQAAMAEPVCHSTSFDQGAKGKKVTHESELLPLADPLIEGGEIRCQIGMNYQKPSENELLRVEVGTFNDVRYRIYYSDGSGSVQGGKESTLDAIADIGLENWSLRCQVDKIDDTHWCTISKKGISVGFWKDGRQFINVGHDHYPGSSITVRVDKNSPESAAASDGLSAHQVDDLIQQMSQGRGAVTRYQEWPYQSNKDSTIDLFGFSEGWHILNLIYQRADSN